MSYKKLYLLFFILLVLNFCSIITVSADTVSFSPSSVSLMVGSSTKVDILGASPETFSIGGYDNNIITASITDLELTIIAKNIGNTIVFLVDDNGQMTGLRVKVEAASGVIPHSLKLQVRGDPAEESFIKGVVVDSVGESIASAQGDFEINILENKIQGLKKIFPGQWLFLSVPVVVTNKNNNDSQEKEVIVAVENVVMDYKKDDYLLISNTPEIINQSGLLFSSEIKKGESARLVYHHMNDLHSPPREFQIVLRNPTDKELKIFINKGIAGPSEDSLFVGHIAMKRFLADMLNESGFIIRIPPKAAYTLVTQKLPKGEYVVTGILKIWLLEGDSLISEVVVCDEYNMSNSFHEGILIPSDEIKGHVRGRFNSSEVDIDWDFDVNEEKKEFNLGLYPEIFDQSGSFKLAGNYGVIHDITLKMINASSSPEDVVISCIPSGGLARAILIFNGDEVIETEILDPHDHSAFDFKNIKLAAETNKKIKIKTIPQAGSYYPVKFLVGVVGK